MPPLPPPPTLLHIKGGGGLRATCVIHLWGSRGLSPTSFTLGWRPPERSLAWNRKLPSFHGRPRGGTLGSFDDGEAMHWPGEAYAELLPFSHEAVGAAGATTIRMAVGIWLLAVVLAVPAAVFSHVQVFEVSEEKSIAVCYPFPEYLPEWYPCVNILVKALMYYLLPLIVIGTFYLLMARHLLSSDVPGESHVFHKQIRTRRKVAKVVLCFVLIFAVCFLPTHVFLLWFYFDPLASVKYNEFWHSMRIVGFCLGFINSCINPIALYCISGTFRKQYNRYLFCCCWAQQGRHRNSLRSTRSGMSRYRSSTMRSTPRPSETITLTTLLQDRVAPADT
ncbi:neuropeptide CCHamide-1 receptor-like [Penaeus vannamei]|uniref:neuropeptide CCHamide-1 receptor-like n=1 Tax=Penaeus vannamei TaxID=6689 RepID=UPI00387F9F52